MKTILILEGWGVTIDLFIYLGFYVAFNTRATLLEGQRKPVKVLYCKLPIDIKQLPAFQLEVGPTGEATIPKKNESAN